MSQRGKQLSGSQIPLSPIVSPSIPQATSRCQDGTWQGGGRYLVWSPGTKHVVPVELFLKLDSVVHRVMGQVGSGEWWVVFVDDGGGRGERWWVLVGGGWWWCGRP